MSIDYVNASVIETAPQHEYQSDENDFDPMDAEEDSDGELMAPAEPPSCLRWEAHVGRQLPADRKRVEKNIFESDVRELPKTLPGFRAYVLFDEQLDSGCGGAWDNDWFLYAAWVDEALVAEVKTVLCDSAKPRLLPCLSALVVDYLDPVRVSKWTANDCSCHAIELPMHANADAKVFDRDLYEIECDYMRTNVIRSGVRLPALPTLAELNSLASRVIA